MDVLVVDGYNIIGAWEELKKIQHIDMSQARDQLIEIMADYQAFSGNRVVIVFDAYYVKGKEIIQKTFDVDVIYTKENETADECIERIVPQYKTVRNQVYVATSDYLEQRVTFGRGALRKSARELLLDVKNMRKEMHDEIKTKQRISPKAKITLTEDVLAQFEEWRRKKE